MKKPTILTSGIDSEYVLGDLCRHLRSNDWEVIELEFGKMTESPAEILRRLAGEDVAYITSAHTNLSSRVALGHMPKLVHEYPFNVAPLEIIAQVKPQISLYVPHDLLCPYGEMNLNEFRFLDLFDGVLAPYHADVLRLVLPSRTTVYDAGWVKFTEQSFKPRKSARPKSAACGLTIQLFATWIVYLRDLYGIDGLIDYFRPLLTSDVRIKLPVWSGIDEIEKAIREQTPAEVIDSRENTVDLIREADVVICNCSSSIHAESTLLGKPTVCLLDNLGFTAEQQRQRLKYFPDVVYHDYRERAPISIDWLRSLVQRTRQPAIRPFRYELVEEIIESSRKAA